MNDEVPAAHPNLEERMERVGELHIAPQAFALVRRVLSLTKGHPNAGRYFAWEVIGAVVILCAAVCYSYNMNPLALVKMDVGLAIWPTTNYVDARRDALAVLEDVALRMNNTPSGQILTDIRTSLRMEPIRKGTTVVLYCTKIPTACNDLLVEVKRTLDQDRRLRGCSTVLEATRQHYDDRAGETQDEILTVLRNCSHGVIGFKDLDRVTPGEMRVLHSATSELGSLMSKGKIVKANEALYLFTMTGEIKSKGLDGYDLLFETRQEFFNMTVGGRTNDESVVSAAAAFRRRIDHVLPIFGLESTIRDGPPVQ